MNYVLKLCGWYPSRVDAFSGDFVQRQAQAISGFCKTVVLFAQKDPNMAGTKMEMVVNRHENLYEYRFYYPRKRLFDKFFSQLYYLKALRTFLPILLKEHGKPDLVHVNVVWRAAIWAQKLRGQFQCPIVITEHSTEYHATSKNFIGNQGQLRKAITQKAFEQCNLLLPVSEQLALTIMDLYGKLPYQVIPNAVDTSHFNLQEGLKAPTTRFIHVSTMDYQKNPMGLLKVFKAISKQHANAELVMVGPAEDALKDFVKADDILQHSVSFTGNLPYVGVAQEMQRSSCLVLFSRYENLPCVILEALCCGLPVISTNVGGIREAVNASNGILIPEGDEKALEAAFLKVLAQEKHFDTAGISREAMQQYSYKSVGAAFMAAYGRLLAHPVGHAGPAKA